VLGLSQCPRGSWHQKRTILVLFFGREFRPAKTLLASRRAASQTELGSQPCHFAGKVDRFSLQAGVEVQDRGRRPSTLAPGTIRTTTRTGAGAPDPTVALPEGGRPSFWPGPICDQVDTDIIIKGGCRACSDLAIAALWGPRGRWGFVSQGCDLRGTSLTRQTTGVCKGALRLAKVLSHLADLAMRSLRMDGATRDKRSNVGWTCDCLLSPVAAFSHACSDEAAA
jgi:hypothetical protein